MRHTGHGRLLLCSGSVRLIVVDDPRIGRTGRPIHTDEGAGLPPHSSSENPRSSTGRSRAPIPGSAGHLGSLRGDAVESLALKVHRVGGAGDLPVQVLHPAQGLGVLDLEVEVPWWWPSSSDADVRRPASGARRAGRPPTGPGGRRRRISCSRRPAGGQVRATNFRLRIYTPATRKAGLEGLTFHRLRHSAGHMMREVGVSLEVIQQRLGHASIRTTADIHGSLPERSTVTSRGGVAGRTLPDRWWCRCGAGPSGRVVAPRRNPADLRFCSNPGGGGATSLQP
ncbi:MAG: tyrosine-type recombinase/integrase [Acidimicrobiales bacterium]